MNSRPGRLRGGYIRKLPARYLSRFEAKGRPPIVSARYRVTGYRDAQGSWVSRVALDKEKTRYGYRRRIGGKLFTVRPTDAEVTRSALVAVEVEIDRGRGATVYYTTLRGPLGR